MSQDQNEITNSGPPRRFLRKGEGLKRFAAYKPPLPTTAKKPERRTTFVRFKLENRASTKREPPLHFIPPEILNDDSINLSTEIPVIPPPKIIHTPVRPNRQQKYSTSPDVTCSPELNPSPQASHRVSDLCKPIPGSTILALSRQIQQIESTVNELREKLNKCECGLAAPKPQTTRRRPTTRATSRAAKSQPSDTDTKKNGQSADADKENSIRKVLNGLTDEVAQLRACFQDINLRE